MADTWAPLFTGAPRSSRGSMAQTEAGPPAAGAGVRLYRVGWITVTVRAPSPQTFTGAGAVTAWIYDQELDVWRHMPRLDEDLAEAAGLSEFSYPSQPVGSQLGRWAFLTNGVGLSGAGGDIEIDMKCASTKGEAV